MISFRNININEKAKYITFTSPIKKNRKGHKHQINKSFKKINIEDREEIFRDLDSILDEFENISKDYLSFLTARDRYNEQAIKWVFEGTEFLRRDNEKKLLNLIEARIPIKISNVKEGEDDEYYDFIYPATILIGPSGSGKTTFLKQIIGAMNTSFPATSQANTTVGPLYVVNDIEADSYMATAKFIGEESLLERIKSGYIESLKAFLSFENKEDITLDEKIIDIIYKKFTIFDDKKVKLQNLLLKDDVENKVSIKKFKKESIEFWKGLKKNANKQGIEIDNKFSNNTGEEFWELFNDSIDEKLLNSENDSIINEFIDIINKKVKSIISEMIKFLSEEQYEWELRILDYKKEYVVTESLKDKEITFELPKMITLKIANKEYKEGLQESFFKTMEFISSAHEEKKGETVFPLINQIRIKGCFKPLWEERENLSNYILIDSEGIGHDLASTTISNELRRLMLAANNISLIQNGAEQMNKSVSLTLKTLIYNAWISKTKFCFNRLEAFDSESQKSVQSKKSFIESNIKNVLRDIVLEEANSKVKIVTDREYIYEDIILSGKEKNSYYIEFLNKSVNDRTGFIKEEDKSFIEDITKNNLEISDEILNMMKGKFTTKFTEEFNPIDQLRDYLKDITTVIDSNEKVAKKLGLVKLFPKYQLDILSGILNNANNAFVNEFIRLLNINTWQTIKAFNSRIAYDWDGREWRAFKPESMLTELLIKHVVSYLLNPNNIEEITRICGEDFVNYINHVVSSQITKKIMMLSTEKVYLELLESCWKSGIEFSGKDSTWNRQNLIQKKIREKFEVNNELYKFNQLYIEVKEIITEEPLLKEIKANYR